MWELHVVLVHRIRVIYKDLMTIKRSRYLNKVKMMNNLGVYCFETLGSAAIKYQPRKFRLVYSQITISIF